MRHTTTVHSRALERAARALGGAQELANYIRVGQTLGILQSKARCSLRAARKGRTH